MRNWIVRAGQPAEKRVARRRAAPRLAVERLEDRCVPSTLQAISVPDPNQPPSDTAAGPSGLSAVSTYGRYVAFLSEASNLVPGQSGTPFAQNVFLQDRSTGGITLVSHVPGSATAGPTATNPAIPGMVNSYSPLISRDGRFIAYMTFAEQISGQNPTEVILYDRSTGLNSVVSHSPNNDAFVMGMSGDGRYIVFIGPANGIVANEVATTSAQQLYLYDRIAGTTVLVTHAYGLPTTTANSAGVALGVSIADDGTVAYSSDSTNVVGSPSSGYNVFLYTPATQTNQQITNNSILNPNSNPNTDSSVISGDGSAVAYVSTAVQVPGQASGSSVRNVFRYDRSSGTTALVSGAAGSATVGGNADSAPAYNGAVAPSGSVTMSHDGRFVAFISLATNLVPGQSGAAGNVFLYDAATPRLMLVSGVNNSPQVGAGGIFDGALAFPHLGFGQDSPFMSLSDDGSLVAYASRASNIVPGQTGPAGVFNAFLYSRATAQNALVSGVGGSTTTAAGDDSGFPVLSGSGNVLAFTTLAPDLSSGVFDANGVADLLTYTPGSPGTALVSRSAFVVAKHGGDSFATSVSADGRYTVFISDATNLVASQSTLNGEKNVFLYDKVTQTTTLVNHIPDFPNATGDAGLSDDSNAGIAPPASLQKPVISADGNFIAFVSRDDNLVPGEKRQGSLYLYLYDCRTGQIKLVNHAPGVPNVFADSATICWDPVISSDGRYVAYAHADIFGYYNSSAGSVALYDSVLDATTDITPPTAPYTADNPGISDNGRFVTYQDSGNVYLFDRSNGSHTLVSHAFNSAATPANSTSSKPALSHDGSSVAFVSQATNLVAGQVPSSFSNVFLYDVGSGAVRLVSGVDGSTTAGGNGNSDSPAVGLDGGYVAYRSDATNLVDGPGGPGGNIFEFSRQAGTQTLISHQAGAFTTPAGGASQPVIDDDGHLITYVSTAGNLIRGQSGPAGVKNVFIWLRTTNANILVSGQGGSATVTGNADSDGPLLTRHSFTDFSSKATDLQPGQGGTSVAYLNTLVHLSLSPNTVADSTGAGVLVGNWTIDSLLPEQYQILGYALPPGVANNDAFSIGNGTLSTGSQFRANYAARNSYQVSLYVDIQVGDLDGASGLLTVFVAPPPPPPLTVTISPEANQPGGPAVHFTVAFSAPVGDFGPEDVLLGGDTGATQPEVSGSGATYTVTVRGMSRAGDISITLLAGQVHDGNGTANQADAAQVHYQPNNPPDKLIDVTRDIAFSDESYRRFVAGKYQQILMRPPDPQGLDAWVSRMLLDPAHYTDELVEANFLNSVEYVGRHHGIGHDWVLGMYHDLLGRTSVGEDEIAGWLGQMAAGKSSLGVATEISGSVERETERVEADYEGYLGRHGDQVGNYVVQFGLGLTNEGILSIFVASTEYYFRGNKGADDPATWVRQAYLDLLGRPAGDDEVQTWLRLLS
jgi:hypothetical protein